MHFSKGFLLSVVCLPAMSILLGINIQKDYFPKSKPPANLPPKLPAPDPKMYDSKISPNILNPYILPSSLYNDMENVLDLQDFTRQMVSGTNFTVPVQSTDLDTLSIMLNLLDPLLSEDREFGVLLYEALLKFPGKNVTLKVSELFDLMNFISNISDIEQKLVYLESLDPFTISNGLSLHPYLY